MWTAFQLLPMLAILSMPFVAQASPAPVVAADRAPEPQNGFQMALRIGYTRPTGSFMQWRDLEIYRTFPFQVPLLLEVGYRPWPAMFVGVFGSIAPGVVGDRFEDLCKSNTCSALGTRFGGEIIGYTRASARFDPWFGFAVGGDLQRLSITDTEGEASSSVRGIDFSILQVGADIRISRTLGMGPFLQYAFGLYTHRSVTTPRYHSDNEILSREAHGWLFVGLRAVAFP